MTQLPRDAASREKLSWLANQDFNAVLTTLTRDCTSNYKEHRAGASGGKLAPLKRTCWKLCFGTSNDAWEAYGILTKEVPKLRDDIEVLSKAQRGQPLQDMDPARRPWL
jgi:hypothetical protein